MPYKVPESFNTIAMAISTMGTLLSPSILLCTGQSSSQSIHSVSSWVSMFPRPAVGTECQTLKKWWRTSNQISHRCLKS